MKYEDLNNQQIQSISSGLWILGVVSGLWRLEGDLSRDQLFDERIIPHFEKMKADENPFIAAIGHKLPEHPSFMVAMQDAFEAFEDFDSLDEYMSSADGSDFRTSLQGTLDALAEHSQEGIDAKSALMFQVGQLESAIRSPQS